MAGSTVAATDIRRYAMISSHALELSKFTPHIVDILNFAYAVDLRLTSIILPPYSVTEEISLSTKELPRYFLPQTSSKGNSYLV